MKRFRKFSGHINGKTLNYRLVAQSTSKNKLEELDDKHADYRILSKGRNLYLCVWK